MNTACIGRLAPSVFNKTGVPSGVWLANMVAVEAAAAAELTEQEEAAFERKHNEMKAFAKECVVLVNNIPRVGPEKMALLMKRLLPKLEAAGELRKDESGEPCVRFPVDDEGHTLGFALCEYANPKQALHAVVAIDGMQFDRSHTFWARTAPAFEDLQSVPDVFVPPEQLPVSRDRPNYKSWLLDPRGRDMFMTRHNDITSVYWNDHVVKSSLVCFLHSYSVPFSR